MTKSIMRWGIRSAACLSLMAISAQAADNPDQPADPATSPFGIGCSNASSRNLEAWIPKMTAIGIHVLRDPGETGWARAERTSWDGLDKKLAFLDSQQVTTGGFFYNFRPPDGFPLDDLPGWTKDVGGVVGHAKGKIKYWEVWNEPPNGTGNAPASDYAKLMVATYDAAKAANPDCLIGLAAKSVDVNYLDQAIKAGAKDHFDYITLHPYENLDCAANHPGAESVFMNIVPTVRKMLAADDPDKVNVPIWFTELGFDASKGADLQGNILVKAYTMGIAQGVNCISWFEGMDGDSGPMGLLQADGTPRPSYKAMAQMIQYLGEHPAYLGWVMFNDKDYGFVFQGDKSTVLITWAPKGGSDNIDFGEAVNIVEPLTGATSKSANYALTDSPIIVDGAPDNLVKMAKDNKTKPFPWGGDYTDAKSVSITFGQTNEEKGLHTQSADSIAADIILYGGSARAGTVPGGNVFMVDPNFLSYASTPIEITAVVRRNSANDPAQIQLTYESTTGDKPASTTYDVPDSDGWHKATWTISDAQFVSMYGFNFRLNSGNYAIQSVTVTKVDQ